MFSLGTYSWGREDLPSNEAQQNQYWKTYHLIFEGKTSSSIIKNEIEHLEKLTVHDGDTYVVTIFEIVNILWQCNQNERWSSHIKLLTKRILEKHVNDFRNKGWQIDTIVNYMSIGNF
jgi:hypothetical protein